MSRQTRHLTEQRAELRKGRKRRLTRRRAVGALSAAIGLTAAAVVTNVMLSPAGAAPAWPDPSGERAVAETIEVSGEYDGGFKRFYGEGDLGGGDQGEGQDPVFKLADGAVLKNVVLGAPAADGIHCMGSCTLENVWWEDVGEDAATFKGTSESARYAVVGGGARKAHDKVFQFNGTGTLTVSGFQVSDFGKLVRSCGNCSEQHKRTIVVDDVDITAPGKSIVGINTNYGDTATLRTIRIHGDDDRKIDTCARYTGNDSGDEPDETGSGPDGKFCLFTDQDISYQ
ncbi:pectate lyase [Streptomyces sp. LHD-70]|uniref:pectate lyase n=1 Tax=Streptomyces sp. LHD-70 TaxID=3072140 RepID=UPI00280E5F21|nr:pectate lyase [Streptomyces sp. LHD-70]MDQ8705245.1 pectate lyase [Streptomyces sp. LHD-70]